MTVDVLLFILLISHCRKAQRATGIRIYQNSTAKLARCMHASQPESFLFNLCIVSHFLSTLWTSLFSLFHLPQDFFFIFCVHWHALNCTELPQRKCSPTHAAVTVTLLIHPVRHVAGCTITLSQQDRNEQGHTQSIWDGTENLHLAASHCGPLIQYPCSFEQFQCGIRLIHLNYHNICRAVSDSASAPNMVVYSSAGPLWARPSWEGLCGPVVWCYLRSLFALADEACLFPLDAFTPVNDRIVVNVFTCFCCNLSCYGTSLSRYSLKSP